MINLEEYEFKNVEITDKNGERYTGYVDLYSSAYDNDEEEDSIGVIPEKTSKAGREFFRSEINSIKVI